jgi:hypothetical protein
MKILDLFPQTAHLETIACFVRNTHQKPAEEPVGGRN